MSQFLSDKFRVLSFFSIILVLYIHSGFHDTCSEISGMKFNLNLQYFISGMIGRCAVPLFYVISGYLFFFHADNIQAIGKKMRKRVKTLLIPYVFAALFFVLFIIVLEQLPLAKQYINNEFSHELSLPFKKILISLFYDAGNGSPWAFHLWYLRDLMILVVISPVVFYLRKLLNKWFVLVCLLLLNLLFDFTLLYAAFWFVSGSLFLKSMIMKNRITKVLIISVFIFVSTFQLIYKEMEIWEQLQILRVVLGVIAIWNIYNLIVPKDFLLSNHKWLKTATKYTFFIYLFHEPTLNIVRKLLVMPFGHSPFSFAFSYLLSPWIFALIFIIIGFWLEKFLPRFYSLIVGGR